MAVLMAAKKTILIVDDDSDLRKTLRIVLSRDYEVLEACDGDEVLGILSKCRPNLLVLDVAMPRMGGLEVLKSLRESSPSLPVLMLTAETDIARAKQALDYGAAAYITKPFEFDDLRAEISRMVDSGAPPDAYRPWRVAP